MKNNENKFADAAFNASKNLVEASRVFFYAKHRALEAQIAYRDVAETHRAQMLLGNDIYAFACKEAHEESFEADAEKAEAKTDYRIAKNAAKATKAAYDRAAVTAYYAYAKDQVARANEAKKLKL